MQTGVTVTKEDLMIMGYGPAQSAAIIRKSKCLMVEKGYEYYNNRRLGRVPTEAVESLLGISITGNDRKGVS